MGAGHSREGLSDISDTDSYYEDDDKRRDEEEDSEEEQHQQQQKRSVHQEDSSKHNSRDNIDELGSKLESLRLESSAKLYNFSSGKWSLVDKQATYSFVRKQENSNRWFLRVGTTIDEEVGPSMQMKPSPEKHRADFVAGGRVWALRFLTTAAFLIFRRRFLDSIFENSHGLPPTPENKLKIFGPDFISWANPNPTDAEESSKEDIWQDADDSFDEKHKKENMSRTSNNLFEEFEEAAGDVGIQSLSLGAMDNSFLLGNSALQVVRNSPHGIHGKGITVNFDSKDSGSYSLGPKKGILMHGETNMMLMNPKSAGVNQLDIETGKIVTEWKFEKGGNPITMLDITNESKAAQLDPSESTFLGLDDNRLCRWDVRDRRGIVDSVRESPVLEWTQGHQFSRGTNFCCFATTGDGSIVVGSADGKIRLYSKSSMRMAKTAFPGLGSPITHVDVTYDGKWILGTTNTYLILVCTVFKDKDGKEKTGFSGRMGSRIAPPRLLKLTPLDVYLAGADNKFHGGQFSWVTENGKQERHLVATVGKFSVIWNFQRVKDSKHECYKNQEGLKSCYCYRLVLKDESIIDSRFMHDKFATGYSPEAPLVVATPLKVSSISLSGRR